MKADAAQLRRALAAPPADVRLYLFHGPDEAGAMAAAAQLGKAMGAAVERIDLDGARLRRDPGRLAEEAASLSLFGDARWVRATGIGEESLEAMSLLLGAERTAHPVVAIAPAVRSTAKIVKLANESPKALASGFYEPSAAEAERLATALARDQGLMPDAGTARRIADAAAGDRLVMAQEIAKLALFLDADADRPKPLDHPSIDLLGADLDDAALDHLVAAIVDGDTAALGQALDHAATANTSAVLWLRATTRRLIALAAMRADIDAGETPGAVMKRHRVFFREEAATLAALRRWPPRLLARAIDRVRAAERAMIASANAGPVLADAAALAITREIAARR